MAAFHARDGGQVSVMTDAHRAFVQAMIAERFIPEVRVKQFYKRAKEFYHYNASEAGFLEFVNVINTRLSLLEMKVAKCTSQDDGQVYWGFINLAQDEASHHATVFHTADIQLLRLMFGLIVAAHNDDMCISSREALNECSLARKNISKRQIQDILDAFVQERWLTFVDGYFSLGPRSLLELRAYFVEEFGERIPICAICKEIATRGSICPNEQCGARVHFHCIERYVTFRREQCCPECHQPWSTHVVEGRRSAQYGTHRQGTRQGTSTVSPLENPILDT